jgi:hypothetical protein
MSKLDALPDTATMLPREQTCEVLRIGNHSRGGVGNYHSLFCIITAVLVPLCSG